MTTPFTDTATAPKIVDESSYQKQNWTGPVGSTVYTRVVTTSRVRHTCLTQAAADSIAARKDSEGLSAVSQRQNQAGWYQVLTTERTIPAWET